LGEDVGTELAADPCDEDPFRHMQEPREAADTGGAESSGAKRHKMHAFANLSYDGFWEM
jgi:hypothetical protein